MDIYSLLPYKKEHLLRKRSEKIALLKLLHALCLDMQESIIKFKQNDMLAFDAQVGETLCQVRAHKLMYLDSIDCGDVLESQVRNFSLKVELLFIKFTMPCKHNSSVSINFDKTEMLSKFISDHTLNFDFSNEIEFLFYSYFLTKYSIVDSNEIPCEINYKLISNILGISHHKALKLSLYYQAALAKTSTEHVLSIAKNVYSDEIYFFIKGQAQIGDRNRAALPCFIVTNAILQSLKNNRDDIVIEITGELNNKQYLTHRVSGNHTEIMNVDRSDKIDKRVIIFKGKTKLNLLDETAILNKFKSLSILDIILANMAKHPQFTGQKLQSYTNTINPAKSKLDTSELLDYTKQYLKYKMLSDEIGCNRDDYTTFYIQHIYCSTIKCLKQNIRWQKIKEYRNEFTKC